MYHFGYDGMVGSVEAFHNYSGESYPPSTPGIVRAFRK